MILIAVCKDYS